ncbi:hypothetical protein MAJHIDBO_02233 [Propionibacterium freudenreichii subsp. shermanii]|nr:hypothetical protein MAJHIDBO_02233 [Propionibacterium freudenreichii subsp. shermanii]SPS10014.1 hypothetical protein MAJHIDBO_02233 [Propionibacterium freudenreichii subsp. shermanii]
MPAMRLVSNRITAAPGEKNAISTLVRPITSTELTKGTTMRTTTSITASTSAVTRTSRSPWWRPSKVVRASLA